MHAPLAAEETIIDGLQERVSPKVSRLGETE
jgi:hypothetical protein